MRIPVPDKTMIVAVVPVAGPLRRGAQSAQIVVGPPGTADGLVRSTPQVSGVRAELGTSSPARPPSPKSPARSHSDR
ncbi:hypothetical protein OG298_44425 (plasmid) [Streptomyces sp. NBC_01005]|uniref:hypothetical protein n=1 Tax=Streptomyces sp. NBC_01005 TaxID=2903715 RepID=UPI002F90F513|nr:hypothetical protein OG298_44425 [Streptomyces sp. NBC_01005]